MNKMLLLLALAACRGDNECKKTVLYVMPRASCESVGSDEARCTLPDDSKVLCLLVDKEPMFHCIQLTAAKPAPPATTTAAAPPPGAQVTPASPAP